VEKEMQHQRPQQADSDPEMNLAPPVTIHAPQFAEMSRTGRQYVPDQDACGYQQNERHECHGIDSEIQLHTLHPECPSEHGTDATAGLPPVITFSPIL
jgi:hypothetical protein